MKPGIYFNIDKPTTSIAKKPSVRKRLAIAATKQWIVEHLDVNWTYLEEKNIAKIPMYRRQHPKFDGI